MKGWKLCVIAVVAWFAFVVAWGLAVGVAVAVFNGSGTGSDALPLPDRGRGGAYPGALRSMHPVSYQSVSGVDRSDASGSNAACPCVVPDPYLFPGTSAPDGGPSTAGSSAVPQAFSQSLVGSCPVLCSWRVRLPYFPTPLSRDPLRGPSDPGGGQGGGQCLGPRLQSAWLCKPGVDSVRDRVRGQETTKGQR